MHNTGMPPKDEDLRQPNFALNVPKINRHAGCMAGESMGLTCNTPWMQGSAACSTAHVQLFVNA